MLSDLASKHCIPCEGGVPPMGEEDIKKYLFQLKTPWDVVGGRQIRRDIAFKNFKEALVFVNRVGEVAKTEGHHPDIYLHNWRKVRIDGK